MSTRLGEREGGGGGNPGESLSVTRGRGEFRCKGKQVEFLGKICLRSPESQNLRSGQPLSPTPPPGGIRGKGKEREINSGGLNPLEVAPVFQKGEQKRGIQSLKSGNLLLQLIAPGNLHQKMGEVRPYYLQKFQGIVIIIGSREERSRGDRAEECLQGKTLRNKLVSTACRGKKKKKKKPGQGWNPVGG